MQSVAFRFGGGDGEKFNPMQMNASGFCVGNNIKQ